MHRSRLWIVGFVLVFLLSGCKTNGAAESPNSDRSQKEENTGNHVSEEDSAKEKAEREIFAMDTYMTVTAFGTDAQAAVDAAAAEIERLDLLLSTGNGESEVATLNQTGAGTLTKDTAVLMERSMELYDATGGMFDIAVYPVMEEWGFTTEEYRVPEAEELENLLPLIDASKIQYDEEKARVTFMQPGMKIDFGGIAKGYTSGRVADILREYGIQSAMINLGGNVQVMGTKTDGSKWRIAIQSPDNEEEYIGVLEGADLAVITSGGYERYFEQDGKTYHHIIDPRTGYPAENGLKSVTIVSPDGTLADGLSTSLFIMGPEKAVAFWRKHAEEFDAVLVDDEGHISVTEGIADSFTSDFEVQVIRKEG
ncbi:FAD:protein FMN transferase [Roseburia hominis]